MSKEYETIILCRNNGRFSKQIKLGDNFISDINKMTEEIFQIKSNYENQSYQLTSLNWKINSLISNKIQFNFKGIKMSDTDEKISSVSANNIVKVIENISEGLYALIDDFTFHRESGDPKVIKDHITLLLVLYQKLKTTKFFNRIITKEQIDMVETQFCDCISSFNISLDKAIQQNNWNFIYNMTSAFFGGCYGYEPISSLPTDYLAKCKLDVAEVRKAISNNCTQ